MSSRHPAHEPRPGPRAGAGPRGFRRVRRNGAALVVVVALLGAFLPAHAATVKTLTLSGGVLGGDGFRYVKAGQALTLDVETTPAKCVRLSGSHSETKTAATATLNWTFSLTAPGAGSGAQTIDVVAFNGNAAQNCAAQSSSSSISYMLDNTGPVLTPTVTPAANAAGWHRTPVDIAWSGVDAGVGMTTSCTGSPKNPSPCSESVAGPAEAVRTATASDLLGNSATGAVTVRIDTTAPTVTTSRTPTPNAAGWNNRPVTVSFACTDGGSVRSGVGACADAEVVAGEGAGQVVSGAATDVAGNSATASVEVNIDLTAPAISGGATTAPGAAGWYRDDVAVAWTCADGLSGLTAGACPPNSTVTGEGSDLAATATVADRAGNEASGSVAGIDIDRTAPETSATAPVTAWNNTEVAVALSAGDALSGVKATHYRLDDGPAVAANSVSIADDGEHTLAYWSEDHAGNVEEPETVVVRIDRTKPRINHTQSPAANGYGWNNADVTVTFVCTDGGSGISACTGPQTVSAEGADQVVTGTATDRAGNTATDPASVSIDKTAPTIDGSADRAANAHGWYDGDVTVGFACGDGLSGVAACSDPATVGEGAGQTVVGSATDAAGNTRGSTVSGINVDKTAPSLSGTAQGMPDGGWSRGDVTVAWACSDSLSGIDGACPAATTLTGEGDGLTVGASVRDRAGNAASATVGGIRIDRTAPVTRASAPAPRYDRWHTGTVPVTLEAGDNLSGVARTWYRIDGGAAQPYSEPFGLTRSARIVFWSEDLAGNVEDAAAVGHLLEVEVDNTAPTISGSRFPAANPHGWSNEPVNVSFSCGDTQSGVAGCGPAGVVAGEGAGQEVVGRAVDNVGNDSGAVVGDINVDLTSPTLTGVATSAPNAARWYRGDVTVEWVAGDGLSGIDPATVPAQTTITGEGAALGAGPATVLDRAGNSATATVSDIRIDRTPPVVSGAPLTQPNAAGWYKDPVTVAFSCTDNLSGVAVCPSDRVVAAEGTSLAVTSDSAADNAGNTAPGRTVGGIRIDSTAPSSEADIICTRKNGWCRGASATVRLAATDQAGLSGVRAIRYKLNGAAGWTEVTGAAKDVPVQLAGSGTASVEYQAVDHAGNVEPSHSVSLKYDSISPTVSHTVHPAPNAAEWSNADTTVTFSASDDSDGSGVDLTTLTAPVTVAAETPGLTVHGEAEDMAGNIGKDQVTVKLDKSAPSITGSGSGSANANGWHAGPVTVTFSCSDALSGVPTCPDPVTLTANGAGQTVTRAVTDRAGNSAQVTVGPFNIDATPPTVSVLGLDRQEYVLGESPALSCSAADATSGVAGSCAGTLTGGLANGVGTFTYTVTATDLAGHTVTAARTYKVVYRYDGVLQPVNDTGHDRDASVSVFKAGSTVPVKVQLKKLDGTVVQANFLPGWLAPSRGSATIAAVDESVFAEPATVGGTYRWDATAQQYVFNWGTAKNQANYYWRIGVSLDDGTVKTVVVGLR